MMSMSHTTSSFGFSRSARVFEKLVIGGAGVFLFAFVFPAEEIFFPDIGPAAAAAVFGRAFLKSECHAGRVMAGQRSQEIGCRRRRRLRLPRRFERRANPGKITGVES